MRILTSSTDRINIKGLCQNTGCSLGLTIGLISQKISCPKSTTSSINPQNLSRLMSNSLSLRCYGKVLPIRSIKNPCRQIFQDRNLNLVSMVPKWTMTLTIPKPKMGEKLITEAWEDPLILWSKCQSLRSGYLRTYRNPI